MLQPLPKPIERVRLAGTASPSLLSRSGACAMRVFGRDDRDGAFLPQLIAGPYVEIGAVVHKTIEIASNRVNIEEVFERLLAKRIAELKADSRRSHYSDLRSSVGELKWSSKQEMVSQHKGPLDALNLESIEKLAGDKRARREFDPRKLSFPSVSLEVPIFSSELKLGGVIDQLELSHNREIRIVDIKTGELTDGNGQPKHDYVIQLAAYEKLCRTIWPSSPIECVLDNGTEITIDITQEIRTEIDQRLEQLRQMITGRENSVVPASDVQVLSQSCFTCPLRFRCGSYIEKLRNDELETLADEHQFNDIKDGFGIVTSVRHSPVGLVVNAKSASGRLIQLRSQYEWQVSQVKEGDTVAFFGFSTKPVRNKATGYLVPPVNFSDSFGPVRNWSAELFLS